MAEMGLSRRGFVGGAVAAACLPLVVGRAYAGGQAGGGYVAPASPRMSFDFNIGWKFVREDVAGAEAVGFEDERWATVSTPHSFNDVDSFRTIISHGGGDRGTYKGLAWYRKHFRLPAEMAGRRVFLEFEGMRQAGEIYLNGKQVGLYENGVTAYGVDVSDGVRFGAENVLAVRVDNRTNYQERAFCAANPKNADGTACVPVGFEWNANDFNPDHGGINRHVWLHVMGKIYQTLPLYYGLESQGVYVHAGNFDVGGKTAEVTVESEVKNGSGDRATVGLTAVVVDAGGRVRAQFEADAVDMVDGERSVMTATGGLKEARFWSCEDPYLYDVYTVLTVDGKVVDVNRVETGFRKTAFKGGAGKGGVWLNDRFVYLKGFAQRSSDEWAGVGAGYPDWMHEYTARLMRDCHGNHMRWMHVAPTRVDADAMCRQGIIQVCPAGDKEADKEGRQWDQRVEVMRATMVYFRNNPSILFWEAGNTVVTPAHMTEMVAVRKQFDPSGGRVIGARGNSNDAANTATTPIAEYYGVMIGQDKGTEALVGPTAMFRAYSAERRDRAPIIETEDFRDEGARRFWDDESPPYFGFKKGPNDTYQYTSESFALAGVRRYAEYWQNRISNADPAHARWSGYVSIYFTDEDADGRQDSSEVARVSGKLDAVRLPKEIYFAHRVMQNERPDLHILGHWSYPAGKKTVKTVYVISNTESVELMVNGKSVGVNKAAEHQWIFAFAGVEFAAGSLKAVGRNGAVVVAQQELSTAGAPAAIRLSLMVGPKGLLADAGDVALIDVEVVDAKGQRCPTDDARVDFTCAGSGVWRGGYNSGKTDSTNNLYLNTELGVNRVAVRSTLVAGEIVVTAKREGLKEAEVKMVSRAVKVVDGLAERMPRWLEA